MFLFNLFGYSRLFINAYLPIMVITSGLSACLSAAPPSTATPIGQTPNWLKATEVNPALDQYERDLQDYERDLQEYNRRAAELKSVERDLDLEISQHRQRVANHNTLFDSHNREVEAYERSVDSHNTEVEMHTSHVTYYDNDAAAYESDAARYNEALARYNKDIETYEKERLQYEGDAAEFNQANNAYARESSAYNSEADQYNALSERERPQVWFDRLERWLAELNRRHAQLANIKSELDSRFQRLTNQQAWLEMKLRELNSEKERLDERFTALDGRQQELSGRSVNSKSRKAELDSRAKSLNTRGAEIDQAADILNSHGEGLKGQIASYEQAWAMLEQMRQSLEKRWSELEGRRLSINAQDFPEQPAQSNGRQPVQFNEQSKVVDPVSDQPINKESHSDESVDRTQITKKDIDPRIQFDGTWTLEEKYILQEKLNQVRGPLLKEWFIKTLAFHRAGKDEYVGKEDSPVTVRQVSPPMLNIYDGFYALTDAEQRSYLGFEAGKAYYEWRVSGKKDMDGIYYDDRLTAFRGDLSDAERKMFDDMIKGGGDPTFYKVKELDIEATFGYLFRVVSFDLGPTPGKDYDVDRWNGVKKKMYEEYLHEQLIPRTSSYKEPPLP
jgi:uncharacterized protein (DUF3084 family)